jgi:predicted permease
MLLTGGALLTRSFSAMMAADRGYDPRGLLTARLTFPHESAGQQQTQRLELLIDRLRSLPGVRAAAFGNGLPLLSGGANFGRDIPSPADPSKKLHVAATWRAISPDYLRVLRSRITRGRSLLPTDTEDTVRVVVVNETFAAQYLGPRPIGLRLQLGLSAGHEWEVVGVVDDLRSGPLGEVVKPEFFVSTRQAPNSLAFDPVLVVRTDRDPDGQATFLRDIVREAAPGAALDSIMSMDDRLRRSLGRPRAYAFVFATIAVLAVAIAAAGVFGLLSYTTALRTREIGIRLAIGAAPRQAANLVLTQALRLILLGVFTGTVVTFGIAELMSHFIYGITPRDVVSFLIAPVALGMVGLLAAALPARHAARLDPTEVLRAQ